MKTRTAMPPNFLELSFSVAHDCEDDWETFRLESFHEDLYVYRCPKCKMSACIDVDIRFAKKPIVKKKAEGRS